MSFHFFGNPQRHASLGNTGLKLGVGWLVKKAFVETGVNFIGNVHRERRIALSWD